MFSKHALYEKLIIYYITSEMDIREITSLLKKKDKSNYKKRIDFLILIMDLLLFFTSTKLNE